MSTTTDDAVGTTASTDRGQDAPTRRVPGEPGVWVLILGEMVAFAVLFGLFLYHRVNTPDVMAESQRELSPVLGSIATLILLASSLIVVAGTEAARLRRTASAVGLFLGAIVCGLGFTLIKVTEYVDHVGAGFTPSVSPFWMYYYTLTGAHLLHLLIGLGVLIFMIVQVRKPALEGEPIAFIEGGACWWHMVDLVWLILFPLVYLMV